GDAALRLAEAAGYVGAGTAEFLLTAEGEFYFLEVNARLQVEHPVTELLTGRDLVADQLAIAAGELLDFAQSDVSLTGHAIEARLYAEDPWHDFLPATGEIIETRWPLAEGTRVDAGVGADDVIGTRYDPLLAKVIVHAESRADAVRQLDDALAATSVLGVTTNRGFLRWLLAQPDVAGGDLSTNFIDQTWRAPASVPDAAWAAASSALAAHLGGRFPRLGFRLNSAPSVAIELDNEIRTVALQRSAASVSWAAVSDESIVIDFDGQAIVAQLASAPTVEAAVRTASHAGATAAGIEAPMPGTVLSVRVAVGDIVEAGQVLMVLEAMKMENNVTAPAAGRVESIAVAPGGQVRRGETLVVLA
ncbi:MAG TPA: biotin/lipoyl-containing protein, partial [Candidatus Limnocylindrales bacterium]|nr:biotin/lipoyl-containing protein [Candidatus Limnocylindrales bacterium]